MEEVEDDDEEWEDESDDEDEDELDDAEHAELGPDGFYCQEIVLKNLPVGEGLPKEVNVHISAGMTG